MFVEVEPNFHVSVDTIATIHFGTEDKDTSRPMIPPREFVRIVTKNGSKYYSTQSTVVQAARKLVE